MSIEDSVVTMHDSMKLYEVKSVFIITDFKERILYYLLHAIVRCTYDIFPIVDGM